MENQVKKCYNSVSCLMSVFIIAFVLIAVAYDLVVSKPQIRKDINEIRIEISQINKKMEFINGVPSDSKSNKDTLTLKSHDFITTAIATNMQDMAN